MKKRIFSALLALMFCFTLLPSEAWAVDTAEEYDYYISSAERLIELLGNGNTAYLDKSFLLTEDIRLSGSWTPVSTFTGTFDGGGHTISGMYTYGGGFFGVIGEGGTVRNLCVDGEFNAGGNAGGISAFNYGLIENCINKGTGNGYWSHVGGIVARNESTGTIRNCYNIGYVYNDGANTGGIVAENHGTIVNCFNVGTVIGTANSDNVTVKSSDYGGIVTNCYYSTDNGETFKNYDDPEDVITPAELAERIGDEGLVTPDGDFAFKLYSLKGKGIQEEPYLIYTADELRMISPNGGLMDKYYRLEADIDLKGSESEQWKAIGDYYAPFKGVFEGNGHKISGLYIYAQGQSYQGLFGYVDGGTIKDLTVDGSVAGGSYVGGIVGSMPAGTVANCTYTGTVTSATYEYDDPFMGGMIYSDRLGGIVGYTRDGKVENCRNFAEVSGGGYVGGIAGYIYNDAQIINCYNEGDIYGNNNVGGVVGESCGTVRNCYNIGKVIGTSIYYYEDYIMESRNIGGIAGSGRNGIIENCYNIGSLDGDQNIGGIAGYLETFGSIGRIKNSYFLDTTAEQGVGESPENGETFAMSAIAFKCGEVAYLLQEDQDEQVWYQNLTTAPKNTYPVLTGDESTVVIKYTFVEPTAYGNPGGVAIVPDGAVITPPGSEAEIIAGENGDETTVDEDGNVTLPKGGSVQVGDTTVTAHDGGTLAPNNDGSVSVPAGCEVKTDDVDVILPDGGTIDENGDVSVDEGDSFVIGDTTVTPKDGGKIETNENGDVVIPNGSEVEINGTNVTLPDGGTVDENGDVSVSEGDSFVIGDITVTPKDGGKIETDKDGSVILPEGSIVEKDGESFTVSEGGAKFDPDTGELTPLEEQKEPDDDTDEPSDEPSDNNKDVDVNVGSSSGENAPSVSLDETYAESLIEDVMASLTDEERKAVESGVKLEVVLTSELIDSTVSAEDIQTVKSHASRLGYKVGQHLNISIVKRIDGMPPGFVTELSNPIRITLEIPENIRSSGRTYAVVRVHNGEAELLEDKDNDPKTITIETDKFSTYTIVYKNAVVDDDDDDSPSGDTGTNNSDTDSTNTQNPYTGSETPITAGIVLACITGAAAVAIKKRRTK